MERLAVCGQIWESIRPATPVSQIDLFAKILFYLGGEQHVTDGESPPRSSGTVKSSMNAAPLG